VVNGVYKLVARRGNGDWQGVWKRSADKATVPGAKQVFRRYSGSEMRGDVIAAADEHAEGKPLLRPAMRGGETAVAESLDEIRERSAAELAALPRELRHPGDCAPEPYPVRYSERLQALIDAS
jgi:nicotinate phosphoribosyltransferase